MPAQNLHAVGESGRRAIRHRQPRKCGHRRACGGIKPIPRFLANAQRTTTPHRRRNSRRAWWCGSACRSTAKRLPPRLCRPFRSQPTPFHTVARFSGAQSPLQEFPITQLRAKRAACCPKQAPRRASARVVPINPPAASTLREAGKVICGASNELLVQHNAFLFYIAVAPAHAPYVPRESVRVGCFRGRIARRDD